jgi:SAM-dependent methyltransferase
MAISDPYDSPLHYDLEYVDQVADIRWYVELARRHGGPLLELGCGNGRITLPIARSGVEIHGVDRSRPMLDSLEDKLRSQPVSVRSLVHVEQADFLKLRGPARFPLVILPFNTIHHCATHRDVLSLLDGVRKVLLPGGTFALDFYLPAPELYGRDPKVRYGERTFTDPRTGAEITSWEQSGYDALGQVHNVRYIYRHANGKVHEVHLPLRVFFPQELRALLDWGGFAVSEEYAGFDRSPLRDDSSKWVMLLEPQ